jgi:hypothetical protein
MRRLCALALTATLVSGCKADGPPSPEQQIRAAATAFVATCARADLAAAADILSEPVQRPFVAAGAEGCEQILGTAPQSARVGAIEDLRSGQFATVAIEGGHSIELERRGELWYVTTPPRSQAVRR